MQTPADASRYVEALLKRQVTLLAKTIDPSVIVVAGGLSSTGVNNPTSPSVISEGISKGGSLSYHNGEDKNYFDVQGFHPADTLHSQMKGSLARRAP